MPSFFVVMFSILPGNHGPCRGNSLKGAVDDGSTDEFGVPDRMEHWNPFTLYCSQSFLNA